MDHRLPSLHRRRNLVVRVAERRVEAVTPPQHAGDDVVIVDGIAGCARHKPETLLVGFTLADILRCDQARGAPVEHDVVGEHCNAHLGTVFPQMGPNLALRTVSAVQERGLLHCVLFRSGADVQHVEPEDFLAGIAIVPGHRIVDCEELQRAAVEDPHRQWVVFEQEPVLRLRLTQAITRIRQCSDILLHAAHDHAPIGGGGAGADGVHDTRFPIGTHDPEFCLELFPVLDQMRCGDLQRTPIIRVDQIEGVGAIDLEQFGIETIKRIDRLRTNDAATRDIPFPVADAGDLLRHVQAFGDQRKHFALAKLGTPLFQVLLSKRAKTDEGTPQQQQPRHHPECHQ